MSLPDNHPPPAFWDNLSKLWFTTKLLREFDRRNNSGGPRPEKQHEIFQFAPDFLGECSAAQLKEIKGLTRLGGPDLTDLRNLRICHSDMIALC